MDYPTTAAVDSTYAVVDSAAVSLNSAGKPDVYYNLASLYNYSFLVFNNPKDSTLNHQFYDEQWIALLQKNDRKVIENLLNNYTDLLKSKKLVISSNIKIGLIICLNIHIISLIIN